MLNWLNSIGTVRYQQLVRNCVELVELKAGQEREQSGILSCLTCHVVSCDMHGMMFCFMVVCWNEWLFFCCRLVDDDSNGQV